ncbi:MAG: hypothetical protein M3R44_00260 [Candidatus Eremiobacteraeota bacterium]|nr:hypothetical protein [Candidatus Eremiobacteraeota bacterium]
MARPKGSGSMGPTRSVRLPQALDAWFNDRLQLQRERSSSEVLVALVHGGLRLREGYMAIHRRVLEHYVRSSQNDVYRAYVRCLLDTFGPDYVDHLERWLAADGVTGPTLPVEEAAASSNS